MNDKKRKVIDPLLVKNARNGCSASLHSLFDAIGPEIYNLVCKLSFTREHCDDNTQEILLPRSA